MKNNYAWKILKKGMKSENGDVKWVKNKWREHKGELIRCNAGFHASKSLFDAIQYVTPGIVCLVEYDGRVLQGDDKLVAEKMRVVKTYKVTKKMWVEWSIYCSKLVLKNFEKVFPDDNPPRLAIKAAQNWLDNPTVKNQRLAESAAGSVRSAAGSAYWSAAMSAALSARTAYWSARTAYWSAGSAAESAGSAGSAAESAGSAGSAGFAAMSATESAAKKKINAKLLRIIGYKT